MTTDRKGAIAELATALAAVRLGVDVYRPIAEGGRYDLGFDATLGREGAVAQLGERQHGMLEATGSSPVGSTPQEVLGRMPGHAFGLASTSAPRIY
jgi:hypothetical protein